MSIRYFAKIDKSTNEILRVHIKNDSKPNWDSFLSDTSYTWKESFPTAPLGIATTRYNPASIGSTYYADADAFLVSNPGIGTSRILNSSTWQWDPSVSAPSTLPNIYTWDDDYCQWITVFGPGNNGGIENSDLLEDLVSPAVGPDGSNVSYLTPVYAPDGTQVGTEPKL